MPQALLIAVRFHDGRYHGAGPWPPSPARLFQALLAGAARGKALPDHARAALAWIEALPAAPIIAAPPVRAGQSLLSYVPNNDLDAVGGDPDRIATIRVAKQIRPRLFDPAEPLLYVWQVPETTPSPDTLSELAHGLYQMGRGVDMAWADAQLMDWEAAEAKLSAHGGATYLPTPGTGTPLSCPKPGSLLSLEERFAAMNARLSAHKSGRKMTQLFTQPPKPRFREVPYDSPPRRLLFELRRQDRHGGFHAWPVTRANQLVETVRDGAAQKLAEQLPGKRALIERVVVGRSAGAADKAQRIRIMPLPSIGHPHVEPAIRRLMLEIPPDCPLPAEDIAWAFAIWEPHDPETGEIWDWRLVEVTDPKDERFRKMPDNYGIGAGNLFRVWRTVTPAALPMHHPRRARNGGSGAARLATEAEAATAVRMALRHAGIAAPVDAIRVQREPFDAKGRRAEAFAPGTRFSTGRLWHVEIAFSGLVAGPVLLGDGRYLGLGLMAPVQRAWRSVLMIPILKGGAIAMDDAPAFLRAARRAVMALARDEAGGLPSFISGHEKDGGPLRSGRHRHIFLAAHDADGDGLLDRLMIAAPWACDRTVKARGEEPAQFERVVTRLRGIRAGRLGHFALDAASAPAPDDPLFRAASVWESHTPYRPTRHAGRRKDITDAVSQDVAAECARRGIPRPEVTILDHAAGPKGGNVTAHLRLRFAKPVHGPLLLGHDSHAGGGLFVAVPAGGAREGPAVPSA